MSKTHTTTCIAVSDHDQQSKQRFHLLCNFIRTLVRINRLQHRLHMVRLLLHRELSLDHAFFINCP